MTLARGMPDMMPTSSTYHMRNASTRWRCDAPVETENGDIVIAYQTVRRLLQVFGKPWIRIEPPECWPADHEVLRSLLPNSFELINSAFTIGRRSPVKTLLFNERSNGARSERACRVPCAAFHKYNLFTVGDRGA